MRTRVGRALIAMRWPLAVAAALTLATAVTTEWCYVTFRVRWDPVDVYCTLADGGITGGQLRTPVSMDVGRSPVGLSGGVLEFANMSGWWDWDLNIHTWKRFKSTSVVATFPQWNVAVLAAAVSGLGFANKRRSMKASGHCKHCHHLLAGARVCPECGTALA